MVLDPHTIGPCFSFDMFSRRRVATLVLLMYSRVEADHQLALELA
jgi:hypothetical protein